MTKYKVKLTQGSTVRSCIIEADTEDDVDLIKCAYEMGFAGMGIIGITDAEPEIEVSAALVGDYERRTMELLP